MKVKNWGNRTMDLKSITLATCVALGGTLMAMSEKNGAAASVAAATAKQQAQADAWDKVFTKNDKVVHAKVSFVNRFGIRLVADCYKPKAAEGKLAAIAVSGPFGAVKEQSSGLYAQTITSTNRCLNKEVL